MKDRRVELKVKIKSLAEEARIIRKEERKAKLRGDWQLFHRLQEHRRTVVRSEARCSQLAYRTIALRGAYPKCESPTTKSLIDFDKVGRLCAAFGPIRDWVKGETQADFEARAHSCNNLRAGMLMALKHINVTSVSEFNSAGAQYARAERNRLRKQRYHEKHGRKEAAST